MDDEDLFELAGSDTNIDDDSSDDLEDPDFLRSLEEASSRPVPLTPTKGTEMGPQASQSSQSQGSPVVLCHRLNISSVSSPSKSAFSLDGLLQECSNKPLQQREIEDMQLKLEEGLKKGGFLKDTVEAELSEQLNDELSEKQKKALGNLVFYKESIRQHPPGEDVLSGSHGHIFDSSLTPAQCGFSANKTNIDKYLLDLTKDDIRDFLVSEVLLLKMDSVSSPECVLRWVLFILSVHPNHLVQRGCYKILQYYLQSQQDDTKTWTPPVNDVFTVLTNFGANREIICKGVENSATCLSLENLEKDNEIMRDNTEKISKYNRENLRKYVSVLSMVLQLRPSYTNEQVTQLIVMICSTALDKTLTNGMLSYEFSVFLSQALNQYEESIWEEQLIKLCRLLLPMSSHHHNRLFLCRLLPPTSRGIHLRRILSFIMLHNILTESEDFSSELIQNFTIKSLQQYLPLLHKLKNDVYVLSSVVNLMDNAVGNQAIKASEKKSLQDITHELRQITGAFRDDVQSLDRTKVKDMMVRITSKWSLILLNVGTRQQTLFENFQMKESKKLEVQEVSASQSTVESDQEDEEPVGREEEDMEEDVDDVVVPSDLQTPAPEADMNKDT